MFPSFSIFHLSLLCNTYGNVPSKISQELLDLGCFTFGTNLGYDKLNCVIKNHAYIAFHIFLFIRFSFSPTKNSVLFSLGFSNFVNT